MQLLLSPLDHINTSLVLLELDGMGGFILYAVELVI